VFLNAAALGDVPIVRQSLDDGALTLNVNCVDYMGRSALHIAVDSDSMELVELLMEKISFECVEEALLHAISKGSTVSVVVFVVVVVVVVDDEFVVVSAREPRSWSKSSSNIRTTSPVRNSAKERRRTRSSAPTRKVSFLRTSRL